MVWNAAHVCDSSLRIRTIYIFFSLTNMCGRGVSLKRVFHLIYGIYVFLCVCVYLRKSTRTFKALYPL